MSDAEGSDSSFLRRAWRIVKWPIIVLLLLYIALVIYRISAVNEQNRTREAVARIHAERITMDDVDGKHLPPPPDPKLADATIEGIDANGNGIRDDVELAIFKLHPTSLKIRAAELQYAKALGTYLQVFNTRTWVAAAKMDSRGYACISQFYPRTDISIHGRNVEHSAKEVKDLVFNTPSRKAAKDSADNYITSTNLPEGDFCDLVL